MMARVPEPGAVSEEAILAHLQYLTTMIGVRLAGSPGEAAAADYVAAEMARFGARVTVEEFPVRERAVTAETLEVKVDGQWTSCPCSLFSSTPGTGGATVAAPLCFFEAPAEYGRTDLSHLHGKAVVHLGCHIESREQYHRLVDAKPAFVLVVDVRYGGDQARADGMFPAYTAAIGAVPMVSVPFTAAWDWAAKGATAARLAVSGGMRPATSQNVIATLPGEAPDAGVLFVGGHHDTQAGSVGADDNGTGVAAVLELTRLLAPMPRRRELRLVSFGAEEQLSAGSAMYVRRHREELARRGRFMFNFDSFGSHLGWSILTCNGPRGMADALLPSFAGRQRYVDVVTAIEPYADHFPFVAAGVPSAWLGRNNCSAGRFFHHRADDDISRVSGPVMRDSIAAAAHILAGLANVAEMPFAVEIPAAQATAVERFWEDLFGGWEWLPGQPGPAAGTPRGRAGQ